MPLYELVCIAGHYRQYSTIRDLVRSTALHVMEHGGHVRSIESWGTQTLPEKMRRHKINHHEGDYWCMQFDCSPITLAALNAQYRIDPRVVRWTNIRLGNNIKGISRHPSQTQGWGTVDGPSAPRKTRDAPGMSLMQEEVMQSIAAQKQRLIMHEQTTAAKAADSARREGGVAGASLPPRMGVNARESERKQVARDGGVNIWNDIAGGVKEKLQSAAATVEKKIEGSSP